MRGARIWVKQSWPERSALPTGKGCSASDPDGHTGCFADPNSPLSKGPPTKSHTSLFISMNTPSAGTLELEHDLKPSELPRHVAIIMDGNGRWAQMRGRKRIWGHHQGADSVREVARAGRELGIEVLTLYAFSEENWSRPRAEVSALMGLLGRYLDKEKDELKSGASGFELSVDGINCRRPFRKRFGMWPL